MFREEKYRMISELNKSDFYKCRGIVNEKGQLEIIAVIEGVNPGRVFVDDSVSLPLDSFG